MNTVVGIISHAPKYVRRKQSATKTQNKRSDNTRNLGEPTCTVLKKGKLIKLRNVSAIATTPIALLGILLKIA
jgi:hypothetical protein